MKIVLFYRKVDPNQNNYDSSSSPQYPRVLKHNRNKSVDVKLSIDTKDKGSRNSNYLDMSSVLTPTSLNNGSSNSKSGHNKNSILMHLGQSVNYSDSKSVRVIDKFYKNQVGICFKNFF
jgi:hypothetical protein